MSILKKPRPDDAKGKCSRYVVIVYNRHTKKQEWHTVNGGKRDAYALERQLKERFRKNSYVALPRSLTFAQLVDRFRSQLAARSRRASTVANYETILKCYLLPEFQFREVSSIRRADVTDYLAKLHADGKSSDVLWRVVRAMKALLFFALEQELIERNPLQRFQAEGGSPGRKANRGTFDEAELRAILEAAPAAARPLFTVLAFTGIRPGEAYALRWQDVDLDRGSLHVCRSWGDRESAAVAPKTAKGVRTVALASELIRELREQQARTGGSGEQLVFGTRSGQPLNGSNVLGRWWYPTLKRAGVRRLDLYSLRHTFASLARNAGESGFIVSQAMGHATSGLVDQVYADALPSGMAQLAERVAERALGIKPGLRMIAGGKAPTVSQSLDAGAKRAVKGRLSG
jgi:integrase